MNTIDSIRATLDKMSLALEQKNESTENSNSDSQQVKSTEDIIAIGSQALQRYQNEYSEADAIDSDTALQFLGQVQNASAQDLEQVHQGLDPERVFKLVGLLD